MIACFSALFYGHNLSQKGCLSIDHFPLQAKHQYFFSPITLTASYTVMPGSTENILLVLFLRILLTVSMASFYVKLGHFFYKVNKWPQVLKLCRTSCYKMNKKFPIFSGLAGVLLSTYNTANSYLFFTKPKLQKAGLREEEFDNGGICPRLELVLIKTAALSF